MRQVHMLEEAPTEVSAGFSWVELYNLKWWGKLKILNFYICTIFNSYIFPFLGGLYCQECGPPLWVRGCNRNVAGLVSVVTCEGIQNIYKCQIVQVNLQISAAARSVHAVALTHDWLVVVPGQVQTIIMTIFDLAFLDNGYKSPVLCHIFNLSGVLWNMNRAQVIILW